MAEVNRVYKEVEYVIRVTDAEFRIILSALTVACAEIPDKFRGLDYYGLRENLLRGK